MNFSLYVIGNPNGYNQYPLDSSSAKFQAVLTSCESDSQLSVFRDSQLVQYVYVRRIPGREILYLGFTLVVTGVYCRDCKLLNDLFDSAFYDVLLKGELLHYENGFYRYVVERFADNHNEINRIYNFFKTRINQAFGNLFVTIPSSFQVGKGQCTLSINNDLADINFAIERNEVVHIVGEEKSIIDSECMQQSIPDLRVEYEKLQEKYIKLTHQKKNPKIWILWLLIAVIIMSMASITSIILINKKVNVAHDEEKVRDLNNKYQEAITDFDSNARNIVHDEHENVGGSFWIIHAFQSLQTISQCESDPFFPLLNTEPVYKEKRLLFRRNLKEAKEIITNENKEDLEQGVSNLYIDRIRERLSVLDDYLEKSEEGNVNNSPK